MRSLSMFFFVPSRAESGTSAENSAPSSARSCGSSIVKSFTGTWISNDARSRIRRHPRRPGQRVRSDHMVVPRLRQGAAPEHQHREQRFVRHHGVGPPLVAQRRATFC